MTKIIYNKIEDLLIGENGILIDLRFGYGLKRKKVDNLFEELDKLIKITSKEEFILKSFFCLIMDSILVISASVDSYEDKSEILLFLDEYTDKLRDFNN
tara:strand:- start:16576 stop:16872 length:297 start_codon:yes stop_codon:yes gene_type:complete